jgi:hypothetical protein
VKSAFAVIEKDESLNGAYYISSTYNEMILAQKKIGTYEILRKDYVSLADYQTMEEFCAHRKVIGQ